MDSVAELTHYGEEHYLFQFSHGFSAMESLVDLQKEIKKYNMFQFSHGFSAMDRAAIFRPLMMSKKSRFSRMLLTSYNTFRK